jgi:hypothetical protein
MRCQHTTRADTGRRRESAMSAEPLEHNSRKPHPVDIVVNGTTVTMPDDEASGAEIKEAGKVATGETLYLITGDHERSVGDDEVVRLHEHMKFESSPDGGVS